MRVLAVLLLGGCSSLLGIDDPVASDGDGGVDAGPRELVAIAIAPDPLALPLGSTRQLEVIGMFSDASTEDLTAEATFSLEAGTAVTVTPDGMVEALAQGSVTIGASLDTGGFTDTIDATVGPPGAERILLSQGNVALKQRQRVQLRATIVFSDGTSQDGTTSVDWSTSDPQVATVVDGRVDAQTTPGSATITASAPGVMGASIAASVSVLPCSVVINELQAGGNGDEPGSNEWAELYNPCTVPIDVSGFTLNYRAASAVGATDTNLLVTLTGTMIPGELRVFGGDSVPFALDASWGGGVMKQDNGALGLRDGPTSTGPLVDAVAYGGISAGHPFVETAPAPMLENGDSVERVPFDGNDTNDGNANFQRTAMPSPRMLNAP